MSDLLFLALFLAGLLLAERALQSDESARLAYLSGLTIGTAYLTRTAALPAIITCPLCFLYRRHLRRALLFITGVLPAVAGWHLGDHSRAKDENSPLLYCTNMGFERATVHLDNLARVLWYNTVFLIRSIGKLGNVRRSSLGELPFRTADRIGCD